MIRLLLLDNAQRPLQAEHVEQTIVEDKNDEGNKKQNTTGIDIEWRKKLGKEEEEEDEDEETRTSRQRERSQWKWCGRTDWEMEGRDRQKVDYAGDEIVIDERWGMIVDENDERLVSSHRNNDESNFQLLTRSFFAAMIQARTSISRAVGNTNA